MSTGDDPKTLDKRLQHLLVTKFSDCFFLNRCGWVTVRAVVVSGSHFQHRCVKSFVASFENR